MGLLSAAAADLTLRLRTYRNDFPREKHRNAFERARTVREQQRAKKVGTQHDAVVRRVMRNTN